MAKIAEKDGLNIRQWVRDRILFLAVGIFVIGAAGYIGADKVFDSHSIWFHPVRDWSRAVERSKGWIVPESL